MLTWESFQEKLSKSEIDINSDSLKKTLQGKYMMIIEDHLSKINNNILWEYIASWGDFFSFEDFEQNLLEHQFYRVNLLRLTYPEFHRFSDSSLYNLYSEYEDKLCSKKKKSIYREQNFLFYLYSQVNRKRLKEISCQREDYLVCGKLTTYFLFQYDIDINNLHDAQDFVFNYYNQYFINYEPKSFYLELDKLCSTPPIFN